MVKELDLTELIEQHIIQAQDMEIGKKQFKHNVLIVDDYPDNLLFVSELLEHNDIKVNFATNGPEALEKAAVLMPDLILLDIAMPVMDGYEICRRLKTARQHILFRLFL
ncbi:MAG: response regulator [Bacteroidales bacterium]|nr:response regulator [Bacteroidales bacterium]